MGTPSFKDLEKKWLGCRGVMVGPVLRCSASTRQVSIKHIFDVISKYFFAAGSFVTWCREQRLVVPMGSGLR